MSPAKVKEVTALYRKMLHARNIEAVEHAGMLGERFLSTWVKLEHTAWMLDQIDNLIDMDEDASPRAHSKAMRWLGFVQGALWFFDTYTTKELRQHNRTDTAEEQP